jgi:hypothetical protein
VKLFRISDLRAAFSKLRQKMLVLAPVTCALLVFFLHYSRTFVAGFLDPSHFDERVFQPSIFAPPK